MKILISADNSASGQHVIKEAAKFVAMLPQAGIHVFTALEMAVISVAGMYGNTEEIKSMEKQAEEVHRWAEKSFEGRKIEFSTEPGNPAEAILQKAAAVKADLIILGTRGKTGLNRMVVGSVAESVLRHANCNVLVIPIKHI